MSDNTLLQGRTALVTGASRGIGKAIAIAMAQAGADVIVTARSRELLASVADSIRSAGRKATVLECDLSQRDAVIALAQDAASADILVNNAASPVELATVSEAKLPHWDFSFAVDFWAPLILMRDLGQQMLSRKRGAIINLSSIVADKHAPMTAAYGAGKAALEALTRIAAMEMAPGGVRVNAIAPGLIRTELTEQTLNAAAWAHMVRAIPVGRAGTVDDVAGLAVYLASDTASFVNGQVICIDGGATAGDYGFANAG